MKSGNMAADKLSYDLERPSGPSTLNRLQAAARQLSLESCKTSARRGRTPTLYIARFERDYRSIRIT